jgi:uncharacterized protein YjbJ (UPF0337 family)
MSRPRVNGPRSLIVTTVEAPVWGFVSFTRVPNGSFLCAAVRPSGRNAWPLAVPEPALYWVALIEPPGQLPWLGAAMATPANQVETSSKGIVSKGIVSMCLADMIDLPLRSIKRRMARCHRESASPSALFAAQCVLQSAKRTSGSSFLSPRGLPAANAIGNKTSMPAVIRDTTDIEETTEETTMDKDRIKGSAEQAKGAVKEAAGKILGDKKLETEGKTDKAAGQVQNAIGGLKDAVRGK